MEKEYSDNAKAFWIPGETWYADPAHKENYIMVGFYYNDGSTEGEFKISWEDVGIVLEIFNDAWEAFNKMSELRDLLARVDREGKQPTIKEFAKMVERLGYKDITERERR